MSNDLLSYVKNSKGSARWNGGATGAGITILFIDLLLFMYFHFKRNKDFTFIIFLFLVGVFLFLIGFLSEVFQKRSFIKEIKKLDNKLLREAMLKIRSKAFKDGVLRGIEFIVIVAASASSPKTFWPFFERLSPITRLFVIFTSIIIIVLIVVYGRTYRRGEEV